MARPLLTPNQQMVLRFMASRGGQATRILIDSEMWRRVAAPHGRVGISLISLEDRGFIRGQSGPHADEWRLTMEGQHWLATDPGRSIRWADTNR